MLMPNTDAAGAIILAERLRVRIEQHAWPHEGVTSSFGIATSRLDSQAGHPPAMMQQALLEAADRALYHSKRCGRNRITHVQDLPVLEGEPGDREHLMYADRPVSGSDDARPARKRASPGR